MAGGVAPKGGRPRGPKWDVGGRARERSSRPPAEKIGIQGNWPFTTRWNGAKSGPRTLVGCLLRNGTANQYETETGTHPWRLAQASTSGNAQGQGRPNATGANKGCKACPRYRIFRALGKTDEG